MNYKERDVLVKLFEDYIKELRHLTSNKDLPSNLFSDLHREITRSLRPLEFKDERGKVVNFGREWTKISEDFLTKNIYNQVGLQELLIDFLRKTVERLERIQVSTIEAKGEVPQQIKNLVKEHELAKKKREAQEVTFGKWRGRWRQWHELQLKNKEPETLAVYHLLNELVLKDPEVAKSLSFSRVQKSALGQKPEPVTLQQAFVPLAELVLRSSDAISQGGGRAETDDTKPAQKVPRAIRDATANQVLKNLEDRYGLVLQGTSPDTKQAAKAAAKAEIGRIIEMAYGVTGARRQVAGYEKTDNAPPADDTQEATSVTPRTQLADTRPQETYSPPTTQTQEPRIETKAVSVLTLTDPDSPEKFVLEMPNEEVLIEKYRANLEEIRHTASQEAVYEADQTALDFVEIENLVERLVSVAPPEARKQLEDRLLNVIVTQNTNLETAFKTLEQEVASFNQTLMVSGSKETTVYEAGTQTSPTTLNLSQPNLKLIMENFERSTESAAFVHDLAHELRLQRLLIQSDGASPLVMVRDIEKLLRHKGVSSPQIALFLSTGIVTGEMSGKLTTQEMTTVLRFAEIKKTFDERVSLVFKKHGIELGEGEKKLVLHGLFHETTGASVSPSSTAVMSTSPAAVDISAPGTPSKGHPVISGITGPPPGQFQTTHDDERSFSGSPFFNAFSRIKNLILDRFPFLNPVSRFFSGIANRFLSALMNTRWLSGLINRALGSQLFGGVTRFVLGKLATAGVSAATSALSLGTGAAAAGASAGVAASTATAVGTAGLGTAGAAAGTISGLLINPVTGAPTALALAILAGITVVVFIFFFNGVDQNMQQALLPPPASVTIPPVNIASGTCPVDGQIRFLRGIYDGAGGTGHGSDDYWTDTGRDPFSFPIPVIHPSCNQPNTPPQCPAGYYGLAIDLASVPMASVPVYVPYVCQQGNCTAPFMTWTVERRTSTNAGDGLILTSGDNGGGQNWKIYLLHLDPNSIPAKSTFTTQQGDNYVGNMLDQGNNTHLHFEVKLGDVPTDPTPFCDGSAGPPPQAGRCTLPQSGLCSVNDPVTRFSDPSVFGAEAPNFSYLCYRESRGYPLALNDNCLRASDGINNEVTDDQVSYNDDGAGCVDLQDTVANGCPEPQYDGATEDYSVGLFQINQAPTTGRCPAAWENPHTDYVRYGGTLPNVYCKIKNALELAKCVEPLLDPVTNTMRTREMSGGGVDYTPWRTPDNPSGNPMCK